MLNVAPLLKNGWQQLHEEIVAFFSAILVANEWRPSLFNTSFYEEVVTTNPGLEQRLRTFCQTFFDLDPGVRRSIYRDFTVQNQIRDLCDGRVSPTYHWCDAGGQPFMAATSDLFTFMYSETLEKATYRKFSGQTLSDHYREYRGRYGHAVCPFCGLENYKDLGPGFTSRDAYDHYLHKSQYPFAAINPDNLFPMCTPCNSDYKKAKEVLFKNRRGHQRRRAPYPASDAFDVDVSITDAFGSPPTLVINLAPTSPCTDDEKFETWLDVLCIVDRYRGRVQSRRKEWIVEILCRLSDPTDADELSAELTASQAQITRSNAAGRMRDYVVKGPFIAYCIRNVDALQEFFQAEPGFRGVLSSRATALRT